MRRALSFFFSLAIVSLLIASGGCKSSNTTGSTGTTGAGGSGDAPPAKPAVGMQIATEKYTLAAGAEEYQCWAFQVPMSGAISLVGIAPQMPKVGVHHFAVFTDAAPYKSAGPYECSMMSPSWGLVSGGGIGTPAVTFPQGTAMNLPAGQQIVLQLHMLNASSKPLDVLPGYVNLVGTNDTNLQTVGLLIAGTLDIALPAHSTGVTVSGSCTLQQPMAHIFDTFPHMHQLGKRITATVSAGGTGMPVTVSDQAWDFKDQGLYSVTGSASVGDKVTVSCTYDNPTDNAVNFGLSSKDEMCVNVLYYYPATAPSTYCGIQ